MRRYLLFAFFFAAAVLLTACGKEYDDSALNAKMDALSSQVAKLTERVNELNTQVAGFNEVIGQWQAGGFVESIQEISGGYTIKFVGGKTVTIYNGKDGKDGKDGQDGSAGATPVISVKADTDGTLYWAVNGEFLLVEGKKVPVAVVPVFSVNQSGELIVTINGVETNLGKVSGAGDSFFTDVNVTEEKVVFTMEGGKSFEIPFVKAFKLVIEKVVYADVKAGDVLAVPYTVTGSETATVMAFAGGAYKAVVDASAKTINVTVPTPAADGQIMVWAQNDQVVSPIIILNFTVEAGGGEPESPVTIVTEPEVYQSIPSAAGDVVVDLTSNVEIVVAQPTVDWVSVNLATKAEYTLTLTVQENTGSSPRETTIQIQRQDNVQTVQEIKIAQLGTGEPEQPSGDLPVISEATTWAGSYFDAIIDAKAASGSTEWTSPDGENFLEGGLYFLAGQTEGTDATTGEPKITYGKFKFKKNENAGTVLGKISRVQMGGTGVLGKRNILQFKVAGNGKLTVIGRSSGDAARKFNVAVGDTPVDESGFELPGKASDAATVVKTVTATEGAVISLYSMESGINFYSIKWEPGESGDEPGDDPGEDPVPGESADLDCPNPPTVGEVDPTAQVGYASGVTGGGGTGSQTFHFNNGKALQTWLLQRTKDEKKGNHTPTVIWLSGSFKPDDGRDFSEAHPWFDVKDVSNLSFIGTDGFVMDRIGIFCVRASNIIIRNINFQQPKANNGADAVSMQECDGVWVDHCTFTSLNQTKDYEDGSTDVTHASKNVTVSWCHYIKTQKSCLVGHSNSASADKAITATFHHNWFDQSSSRHPRVRFGTVHVYNNLFDGNTTYGVGSAYGAKVLVEYNYFDGVQLPTDICTYPAKESGVSNLQGSVAGYLYPTENVYVNRPDKAKDPYPLSNVAYTKYGGTAGTPLTYSDFKPSYAYTVTAAADVPALVKANAGYGKLGYTEAPIPVDNAGITDFNGSDDDPVDPDPGESDDPEEPAGPATYTLYATGSKQVATTGGDYFTYSTDTADFRSPSATSYNGPFTIGGTEYSFGLKFNSAGYVSFTTSATLNTTVQFYFARRKESDSGAKIQLVPTDGDPQVFETPFTTYGDSGEIALAKGASYTIKQKSSEQGLILVVVKETE